MLLASGHVCVLSQLTLNVDVASSAGLFIMLHAKNASSTNALLRQVLQRPLFWERAAPVFDGGALERHQVACNRDVQHLHFAVRQRRAQRVRFFLLAVAVRFADVVVAIANPPTRPNEVDAPARIVAFLHQRAQAD
jgi:hypothetical protein